MNQPIFLSLYIVLVIIEYITLTTLTILNLNSILKNEKEIPPLFRTIITKSNYLNIINYSITKEHFEIINRTISTIVVTTLLLTGSLGLIERTLSIITTNYIGLGLLFIAVVSITLFIIELPFSLYSTFVIEEKFGFNKMTFKSFVADTVKQSLLSIIIGSIIIVALFLFMDKSGPSWWIWASVFFITFQMLIFLIYPTLIAPIFNKFTPLEDGELKERLEKLSIKAQFNISGIFVMDGSKRSGHSNAYFTGMGKSRRIVLYDTLIESLTTDELCSVLAHEIGHWKRGHIRKRLLTTIIIVPVIFFLLANIINFDTLYTIFGMIPGTYYGLLILISMISSPFTFMFTPISNHFSRKHEFEADNFAKDIIGGGEDLVNALLKLSKENLSNLTPHPSYSAFHYSHPPVSERAKKLI